MLIYDFGYWENWLNPHKVTFDPENKLIIINPGVTSLDVGIDLYSDWKEWVLQYDNAKWASAFRSIGGDPTSSTQNAPAYYFLTNGWKIYAEDVEVVIQLNLYSDDGLSPFIINNAAVTNRGSDVPIVKSELEQRLTYGDRIYYDENSPYSGVIYPYGTIAQPINNPEDAESIAAAFGITQFYSLSDVTLLSTTTTWEGYSVVAANANLTAMLDVEAYHNNMVWTGFIIDGNFGHGVVKLENCVIINALYLSGEIKNSQINGTIIVSNDLVISGCYGGIAGSSTPIFDMNSGNTTSLSLRSFSGGVQIINCDTSGCTTTIELIAGQVKLEPSCTAGYIDLRGVGYITNNSNGSTVKTTGFIDSYEEFINESKTLNEQLAYQNELFYDPINGITGITYPVGTSAYPSNNIPHLYYLSEYVTNIKTIKVRNNFIASGVTAILPPGVKMDYFTIIGDSPGTNMYVYDNGIAEYVDVIGFDVYIANLSGFSNNFTDCTLYDIYGLAGNIINCGLAGINSVSGGTIRIGNNTTFINCHPENAGDSPYIELDNPNGTQASFRNYSGDIHINKMEQPDDFIAIDLQAGHIFLTSGCTSGTIDLRGVGYLTNNSGSGCTVITTGLVDSFQTYIEETRTTDERLSYGDIIYYDETSIYTGTTYPVGTIVQPINNANDAIYIASNKGINKFLTLSDINLSGITGQFFQNYTISAIRENVTINLNYNNPLYNTFNNMLWENIKIYGIMSGGTNTINNCEILLLESFKGIIKNSKLIGNLSIDGSTDIIDCYSGDDIITLIREIPHIYLNSPLSGIALDFRNYSGDLNFSKIQNDNDYVVIDINAGKIELTTGCTNGYVEIRGVGYLIDNSGSGCTVITTGFINSFESYVESTRELNEQLSYQNELFYDPINGITGITYPVGTSAYPSNNIPHLYYLSEYVTNIKTIKVRNNFIASGITAILPPGVKMDYFTIIGDSPGTNMYVYDNGIAEYVDVINFDIQFARMGGLENNFYDCNIYDIYGLAGKVTNCGLNGRYNDSSNSIRIENSTTFIDCHPVYAYESPHIELTNTGGTNVHFANYSGNISIDYVSHPDDIVVIDLQSGHIFLNSGCTDGLIDLRGVGYLTNNSGSMCTVITTGLVDSFQTYVEESKATDEILAYGGKIYLDSISGVTGTTYPVGTIATPVNNLDDLLILSARINTKDLYLFNSFIAVDASGNTVGIPNNFNNFNTYAVLDDLIITVNSGEPTAIKNSHLYGFHHLNSNYKNENVAFTKCNVENFQNFNGTMSNCILNGTLSVSSDSIIDNSFSGAIDTRISIVSDYNSGVTLLLRKYAGNLILDSVTNINDKIEIDLVSGRIEITSGCTSGTIDIRGVGAVIDNSASGCTVIREGQLQASPYEYGSIIVLDTINGESGIRFPIGTDSKPVNNISDALILLSTYSLEKIKIIGALTIENGEDLSGIAFVAERSVGNYLFITDAITDHTYIENLTISVVQSGTCRYTNCVILDITNFDGGAKDCLIVGNINVTGTGSNYFTNCDRYVTNPTNYSIIDIGDKNLNIIRCRGNYKITNKTSINTTAVDLVAGIVELDSTCVSGSIYIGGVCEVIDNSSIGCTVVIKAISNPSITNAVWDEPILNHTDAGSTGNALYNVGAGADPNIIANTVWNVAISGFTTPGSAGQVLNASTGDTAKIDIMYDNIKRILGLTQENFKIVDYIYDNTSNTLQSATIKIYETSVDCDNDVNEFASYSMEAVYDSSNRLINYKVIKN